MHRALTYSSLIVLGTGLLTTVLAGCDDGQETAQYPPQPYPTQTVPGPMPPQPAPQPQPQTRTRPVWGLVVSGAVMFGVSYLIHAALIDYPIYRDPVSGLPCEVEVIVDRLAAGAGQAGAAGRLLSKAQGLAASYAWLWR